MKNNVAIFEIEGVGRVIGDLSNSKLVPIVQYEDGNACLALQRNESEAAQVGYESVAIANFVHEAVHLFIAHKVGFIETSVAYREGLKADFNDPEILEDAKYEEQIVLGFQAFINDALGEFLEKPKVKGFSFHVVTSAVKWSEHLLAERGFNQKELAFEFISLFHDQVKADCGVRHKIRLSED